MMATRSLDDYEDFVREKVEQEHMTHGQISEQLCSRYPGMMGFSICSIERFCQEKGSIRLLDYRRLRLRKQLQQVLPR